MTPDHTHAAIAIAALKKGMNVIVHKPLANRVLEARAVIETARAKKVATHFMPASEGTGQKAGHRDGRNGAIGTLREIHNWSMRPMWPQFAMRPTDTPPVPAGFDWTLWLGPSLDRPYHPELHPHEFPRLVRVRRRVDRRHGALQPLADLPDARASTRRSSVESTPSHVCAVVEDVCQRIKNDYSFPAACTVRMRFAAKGDRAGLDIFWYDGGIKPPVPEELMAENQELAEEGMLFVGDKGKILGGFRAENAQIIPEAKMRAYRTANNIPEPAPPEPGAGGGQAGRGPSPRDAAWIAAFKGGPATYGDFTLAGPICDAVNLAAISLRLGGKRLLWDAAAAKITNLPDANRYLTREYRPGWEIGK